MLNKSLIYSLILCGQQLSTVVLDLSFSRYPMESRQRGGFWRQCDSAASESEWSILLSEVRRDILCQVPWLGAFWACQVSQWESEREQGQVSGNEADFFRAVICLISGALSAVLTVWTNHYWKEFPSWPRGINRDLLYLQTFFHMVELGDQVVKKVSVSW